MASRASPKDGSSPERKDRLIQTRVAEDLEATLKQEARRQRLSVSHLIRNVLEDAFDLVDDVVSDVDQIVSDSVHLARNVGRNARRIVESRRREEAPRRPDLPGDLSHVLAWSEVVLNRPMPCAGCGSEIPRGAPGFMGLSDDRPADRVWLCATCVEDL